jgi:hypothetical protein
MLSRVGFQTCADLVRRLFTAPAEDSVFHHDSMLSRPKAVSKHAGQLVAMSVWRDSEAGQCKPHPSIRVLTTFGRYSGCSLELGADCWQQELYEHAE